MDGCLLFAPLPWKRSVPLTCCPRPGAPGRFALSPLWMLLRLGTASPLCSPGQPQLRALHSPPCSARAGRSAPRGAPGAALGAAGSAARGGGRGEVVGWALRCVALQRVHPAALLHAAAPLRVRNRRGRPGTRNHELTATIKYWNGHRLPPPDRAVPSSPRGAGSARGRPRERSAEPRPAPSPRRHVRGAAAQGRQVRGGRWRAAPGAARPGESGGTPCIAGTAPRSALRDAPCASAPLLRARTVSV